MVLHLQETALEDMGFSIDLDSHIGRMTFAPPSEVDISKQRSSAPGLETKVRYPEHIL